MLRPPRSRRRPAPAPVARRRAGLTRIVGTARSSLLRNEVFLRTFAAAVITLAGVYIAWQANRIADQQTAILRQQTDLMNRERLPAVYLSVEDGRNQQGGIEGAQDIAIHNIGTSVANLRVEATTFLPVCVLIPDWWFDAVEEFADTSGPAAPLVSAPGVCENLSVQGYFDDPVYTNAGTGELARLPAADLDPGNRARLDQLSHELAALTASGETPISLGQVTTLLSISYVDLDGKNHFDRYVVRDWQPAPIDENSFGQVAAAMEVCTMVAWGQDPITGLPYPYSYSSRLYGADSVSFAGLTVELLLAGRCGQVAGWWDAWNAEGVGTPSASQPSGISALTSSDLSAPAAAP